MKKNLVLALSFCILFCSCKFSDRTKHKIQAMSEHPVLIDYANMPCWSNDSIENPNGPVQDDQLRLIVYTDSSQCTSCYIKSLYQWMRFVDMEKVYRGFRVDFIMGVV